MIFHTWRLILEGKQTQTRRIVKPSEDWATDFYDCPSHGAVLQYLIKGDMRVAYAQGRVYTVTTAHTKPTIWYHPTLGVLDYEIAYLYGKKQILVDEYMLPLPEFKRRYTTKGYRPLQIKITQIRREDVRNISAEDVLAEGFSSAAEFWVTWCKMHDASLRLHGDSADDGTWHCWHDNQWHTTDDLTLHAILMQRPTERYQAWVLTFEVVK